MRATKDINVPGDGAGDGRRVIGIRLDIEAFPQFQVRAGEEGHVTFGTGSGQTTAVVFPDAADRAASQCNDFNGNVVLPAI